MSASSAQIATARPDTARDYRTAVERVLTAMRQGLGEELSLNSLSRVARLSPYHFHRIFRRLTGIPPGRFLGALRLEEAMRLLLTTDRSVTDICFDVGYNSLGTFTTRFTDWVGMPPTHLRELGSHLRCSDLQRAAGDLNAAAPRGTPLGGRLLDAGGGGPILIGLFERPIPSGRPLACALLDDASHYRLGAPQDGRFWVLAAALGTPSADGDPLLRDVSVRAVAEAGPLTVRGARVSGNGDLRLRSHRSSDPPLLLALPVVLDSAGQQSQPPSMYIS